MSQVAMEKIDEAKIGTASAFEELKGFSGRIRQRAFEFFEGRQGGDGFDREDWFTAERDLLCTAESDLVEKDGRFEVRINAPGFEPGEVKVTALPDALIVKADSTHTRREGRQRAVLRVRSEDAVPTL